MRMPFSEKGPQSSVDEYQYTTEHSRYDEQHGSREMHTSSEHSPVDELPKPKKQPSSNKKKQGQNQTTRLLAQYVPVIVAVTTTVAVVLPSLPAPTADPFDPYFELVATEDPNVLEIVLNESLSSNGYTQITLYDARGEELFLIAVSHGHDDVPIAWTLQNAAENGSAPDYNTPSESPDWNSEYDTYPEETKPTMHYYLFQGGLPEDEYTLRFTSFSPDTEEDFVYERTLTLGTMVPFDFNTTVDLNAGTISLHPLVGDLTPYETFYAELWYQGELVSESHAEYNSDDGSLYLPLNDFASGTYELRLCGIYPYESVAFYTSLWTCAEFVVPSLPEPSFAVVQETIGLTTYQCTLIMENVNSALTASLMTADGYGLELFPLPEGGVLTFENLTPETDYILLLQNGYAEELFTYFFTTGSFVQVDETNDSNVLELVLHHSLPTSGDCMMTLYDTQGNQISVIETSFTNGDGPEYPETVRYYLFQSGLPRGEYVLQFTYYVDGQENFYVKTLTLGTMTYFDFNTTVDLNAGTISLHPLVGDLTPYETFYAELWYQGELVSESHAEYNSDDGSLYLPLNDFASGTYELRLCGIYPYESVAFYTSLWTCAEFVVPSLPEPSFAVVQETIGLTTYQCTLIMENVKSPLIVLLMTEDGAVLQNVSLPENGELYFENLSPETTYTILLQNEQSVTLYSFDFTTDSPAQGEKASDSGVS